MVRIDKQINLVKNIFVVLRKAAFGQSKSQWDLWIFDAHELLPCPISVIDIHFCTFVLIFSQVVGEVWRQTSLQASCSQLQRDVFFFTARKRISFLIFHRPIPRQRRNQRPAAYSCPVARRLSNHLLARSLYQNCQCPDFRQSECVYVPPVFLKFPNVFFVGPVY